MSIAGIFLIENEAEGHEEVNAKSSPEEGLTVVDKIGLVA